MIRHNGGYPCKQDIADKYPLVATVLALTAVALSIASFYILLDLIIHLTIKLTK